MSKYFNEFPQHTDSNGNPNAFYTVYFGLVNQDPKANPKAPFSDKALSNAISPTQVLNATGSYGSDIFLDGEYSIRIEDTLGALWRESPCISGSLSLDAIEELITSLPNLTIGTNQVNYQASNNFPGGVDRTQESKNGDVMSVMDYGASNDGTDVIGTTAAFVSFFADIVDGSKPVIPPGFYLINADEIGCAKVNVTFSAYGAMLLTNSTDGILIDLNTAATSGDDNTNIKRQVKWFGGDFYNLNGTNIATNNTCTALKAWACRDLTLQDIKVGSSNAIDVPVAGTGGFGFHKGIDASSFDGIRIINPFIVNCFHPIYFDDVYTQTKLQNVHILQANLVKCLGPFQIFFDTAFSDVEISFADTAQPDQGTDASPTNTFPGFLRFPSGTVDFETRGLVVSGINTEQNQSITGSLVQCVARDNKRAANLHFKNNSWLGNNIAIDIDQCEGIIDIADFFLTPEATAIKIRNFTGTLNVEGSTFKQATTDGTITAMADSGTSPGVNTTITSVNTLTNGDVITIGETIDYDNSYEVSQVSGTAYDIVKVFVTDEATGTWGLGKLIDAELSGTNYQINWGSNQVPAVGIGGIIWSQVSGNSIISALNRTDGPFPFGSTFNGGASTLQKNDVQSRVFNGAGVSTGTTDLTPFYDIGNNLLFERSSIPVITAVQIAIIANDEGSFAGTASIRVYTKGLVNTDFAPVRLELNGTIDDQEKTYSGWVPVDTNGEITVDVVATGAGTLDLSVAYLGYM